MNTSVETATAWRLPLLKGYTKEFYDWCAKGELRFQRCADCGAWRHPPRPMCAQCNSMKWEWGKTAGKGKVYCWTVVHAALDPVFKPYTPYAAVVVELEEGPRLATWVSDVVPDKLRIGMPVKVWFDSASGQVTLPKFKPA